MAKQATTPPFTLQVNELGKLRVTNTETGEMHRLYAKLDEVKALGEDKWYKHLEVCNGEYGQYMKLQQSVYKDVKWA